MKLGVDKRRVIHRSEIYTYTLSKGDPSLEPELDQSMSIVFVLYRFYDQRINLYAHIFMRYLMFTYFFKLLTPAPVSLALKSYSILICPEPIQSIQSILESVYIDCMQ